MPLLELMYPHFGYPHRHGCTTGMCVLVAPRAYDVQESQVPDEIFFAVIEEEIVHKGGGRSNWRVTRLDDGREYTVVDWAIQRPVTPLEALASI